MNSEALAFHGYTFENRPSGKTLSIELMARDLMPPSFSTQRLIENMPIAAGESVLDLGAGPGIVGIAARLLGAGAVTFADIVDDARATTQINVARNLPTVPASDFDCDYVTGDLYAPLGRRRFDHIIANPPSIPSPGDTLPLPYRSGPDGRALHDPIQRLARYYLNAGGRLTLVHGSLANLDASLAQLAELGFTVDIAGPFENPFADFFPRAHIEASLALGATRWEMVRQAIFPFARPGMISASMLGLGRALGETIAVALMLSAIYSINWHITEPGGITFAANIALKWNEAGTIGISALIASGLVLFVITLAVNMAARLIIARRAEFSGAH